MTTTLNLLVPRCWIWGQDEFPDIIANNDCIFLLDYAENNVTMLYSSAG